MLRTSPKRQYIRSSLVLIHFIPLCYEGHTVDFVSPDFAKAFDSVNNWFLLLNVKSNGIDGKAPIWKNFYTSGGSYQFQIDGAIFDEAASRSNTFQCSVTSTPRFLLYLNDMPAALGDSAFLLPDDMKLVLPGSQSSRLLSSLSTAWTWDLNS